MAKSLKEQIDQIARDDDLVRKAQERREANIAKIVGPIAEKIAGLVRSKIEDELKADVAKAGQIDMSREALKAAIDTFVGGLLAPKSAARPAKQKPAEQAEKPAAGPASPATVEF